MVARRHSRDAADTIGSADNSGTVTVVYSVTVACIALEYPSRDTADRIGSAGIPGIVTAFYIALIVYNSCDTADISGSADIPGVVTVFYAATVCTSRDTADAPIGSVDSPGIVAVCYVSPIVSRDTAHTAGSADRPGTIAIFYAATVDSRDTTNVVLSRYVNIHKAEIFYFGALKIPEQALIISIILVDEKIVNNMTIAVKIPLKNVCGEVFSYGRPFIIFAVKVKVARKKEKFSRIILPSVDLPGEVSKLGPGTYAVGVPRTAVTSGKNIVYAPIPQIGKFPTPRRIGTRKKAGEQKHDKKAGYNTTEG
jgi:hypothetical protein